MDCFGGKEQGVLSLDVSVRLGQSVCGWRNVLFAWPAFVHGISGGMAGEVSSWYP